MKDITAKKLRDAADAVKRWICNNPDAVCLDKLWKAGRTAADLLDRLAEREQLAAERELRAAGRELIRQARMAIVDAGDALDKVDAEHASDAVRTSAREFIAAVDEHCELEVGDAVEIIGPWYGGGRSMCHGGKHGILDVKSGDEWCVEIDGACYLYPASSLRKITAPKHKVGDRVKVTSGVVRQYKPTVRPGSIGVIATICEADKSYMVEFDDGSRVAYFESEMEPAPAFKVGDRVKVVIDQPGLHWPASTLGFVATVGHDFTGHTYFVKMKDDGCGIWQGESSLEPAPAQLLPVGTLVTIDDDAKVYTIAKRIQSNYRLAIGGVQYGWWPAGTVQPLIPAYLAKGNTYAATTGKWRISDGKLELEIIYAYYRGYPSTCYWPLAECKPLALDARWEAK